MKIIIENDNFLKAKEYQNLETEVVDAVTALLERIVDSPYNDSEYDLTYELPKAN